MIPPSDGMTDLAPPTSPASDDPDTAVAVIGMAGRFPGARSVEAFADMLWSGREGIARFDARDADHRPLGAPINDHSDFVPAAAPLDDIDRFDAAAFGLGARDAIFLDPQHRLFLECAVDSLDDAALDPRRLDGTIGVFGGCGISSYLLHSLIPADIIHQADPLEVMMGCDKDFLATRVAYLLDLTGPAVTVQSACSTALLAVHIAVQSLLNGECDAALAGGVTVTTPQRLGYIYQPTGIRSPDGRCRPFDAQAAGTVFGSGCGVVLLRPLRDALGAGDPIRAVIRATAANNDGQSKVGFTAPSVTGQGAVLSEALAVSGLSPEEVGYIEGHGTATPMGDPIEVAAIREVYGGRGGTAAPTCLLGSVKSNVGHLDAASGIAGFIKTVLSLERGEVPPTLHFQTANPEMRLNETRFRVSARVEPWPRLGIRRAAVSSFGVGGTNVHAVLEQAPQRPTPVSSPVRSPDPNATQTSGTASDGRTGGDDGPFLLPLSASSPEALATTARALAEVVPSVPLTDMAWTLQTGRRARPVRATVVAYAETAADHLCAIHAGHTAGDCLRTAFLFAGQGSQHPGMARSLAERYPAFRETLETCLQGFEGTAGLDLGSLLLDAAPDDETAAEALRQTEIAQAAIFSHALACARLWRDLGIVPEVLLGHSIGQWAAAVVAEVVALPDAIALVARRGALMQAAPQGAMLSVPLSEAACRPLLGEDIDLAAVNGSALCVLSGSRAALARIAETRTDAKWLRTSHAFHSRAMTDAATAFTEAVARISLTPPAIPILSNRTGAPLSDAEAVDPAYWGAHLRETVAFHRGLITLSTLADAAVECGPGDGLSGLAAMAFAETGRHDALAVATAPSVGATRTADDRATLLTAVGRLWERGVSIDWETLNAPLRSRRVRLPATAFDRQRHWPAPPASSRSTPVATTIDDPTCPASDEPAPPARQAPFSPLDRLCRLWATTLAVPAVDPDERFLDLGGTSVIAMQLVARCAADGFKVSAADVMTAQTPRALLARVSAPAPTAESGDTAPGGSAPGDPGSRVLTAAQALALTEGETRPIRLRATVGVSPVRARDIGETLAGALDLLRLRIRTSWRGTEVSVLAPDTVPAPIIHVVEAPELPVLALEKGLSGELSVQAASATASACTLEVALHPVTGDAVTTLAVLEAWLHRCLDGHRLPSVATEALPPDRHAPVTERLFPPCGPAGTITRHLNALPLPPDTLSTWTATHRTDEGLVLAAAGVVAGGAPEATRVTLRGPAHLRRAFSLPSLPPGPRLDDVILALKAATNPEGAPLPIAHRAGVGVLWLGDLSRFDPADAAAMVAACADAGVPDATDSPTEPRTMLALARHRGRCLVSVVGTDPARKPHHLLVTLLDTIKALPRTLPSAAHGLSPEAFTAADAPLADLRRLFGLDTADAA